MEGTCNECVFPLSRDDSHGGCRTDTSLVYAAGTGKLSCVKELIAAGADVNATCECHGNGPLLSTAMQGRVDCLHELIAAGAEINKEDNESRTALMIAARKGNAECLKELIVAGADINKKDKDGLTALMFAAGQGHVECLKELIAAGADINKQDNDGHTPLWTAAYQDHVECLKELIAAGADINKQDNTGRTALWIAAGLGHVECLKKLIAAGADINKDRKGRGALMFAAIQGHVECLKELIAAGADINKENNAGRTALTCAAQYGHVECLHELLIAGAEVNKQMKNKASALHLTCASGHVECLNQLLEYRADKEITDGSGSTPLLSTIEAGNQGPIQQGHINCIKQLIDAGANLNFRNQQNQHTPLMEAVSIGHEGIVKILLTAEADVNINFEHNYSTLTFPAQGYSRELKKMLIDARDDVKITGKEHIECSKELIAAHDNKLEQEPALSNVSAIHDSDYMEEFIEPLTSAVKSGKVTLAEELLKSRADVNATNEYGDTPLMAAITSGSKAIFQLLLSHGADVNAENNKGETALYLAVTMSHAEYDRMQSTEQNKQNNLMNEAFLPEGTNLMVYTLLREGAHLHKTKSGLNPCTVHLTSVEITNPNPTVLKLLDAGGSKENVKELSSVHLLQDSAQDFIREHLKQAYPKRNLYFTVPQLGLPQRLQSSLLFHAVQKANLVPNSEEKIFMQKLKESDIENVQHLINIGVDVNIQDENDMTPLMIASQAGYVEIVKQLIKAGADVNLQNSSGDTALIYALKDWSMVSIFIKKTNPMEEIYECIQILLKHGAEINIQGKDGDTALMTIARRASRYSQLNSKNLTSIPTIEVMGKCMIALIQAGADPNLKNDQECTALVLGADCLLFVNKLIAGGADVNWKDKDGNTALTQAADCGEVHCMKTLIEAGAEINSGRVAALITTASKGHIKCMKLLIKGGADLDIPDEKGETALMKSAIKEHMDCVKLLIREGADLDIQDENGHTALSIAALKDNVESVKLLIQRGADLDKRDREGFTASMLAARTGADNCFNALLKAGAKVDPSIIRTMCRKQMEKQLNPKDAPEKTEEEETENLLRREETSGQTLRGFKWKSLFKLSTLCKNISNKEMLDVIPLYSGCPMTTKRKRRRYLATVAKGQAISLQGDKSDVKLEIKEGCPKRAYLMEVRTDLSSFGSIIPDDECFISPIVDVIAPAKTETSSYTLRIPHCLYEEDDKGKVKVRLIHENRVPAVVEVPKGNAGPLYYDINDRFIELHTTHFTKVICTICQHSPYHCRGRINSFWFASFDTHPLKLATVGEHFRHSVEIRPYFGGVIHTLVDFRKSVEAVVNLRYVTQGTLKRSGTSFNPELGQIRFSLKVADAAWEPRQGLNQWDPDSRTFTEEKELWEVIGPENTHKCRDPPFEAAVYSLKAESEKLDRFWANSRAELTVEVDKTSKEQEKKQERSTLELPVDFSPEDVAKPPETDTTSKSTKIKKPPRFTKEQIQEIVEKAGLNQISSEIHDREIARLALLFSPSRLETVALQYFGTSEATIGNHKAARREDTEGFNRDLLTDYRNKGHSRKDLYRILLQAESEGIMDDVNMEKVEKMLLDPKAEMKSF